MNSTAKLSFCLLLYPNRTAVLIIYLAVSYSTLLTYCTAPYSYSHHPRSLSPSHSIPSFVNLIILSCLPFYPLLHHPQGMATRITSHRTVLGRATSALLSLGDSLVGTSSAQHTRADSSAVSGLNFLKQPSHCGSRGEQSKPRRKEQFVVIGADPSIARCVCTCAVHLYIYLTYSK